MKGVLCSAFCFSLVIYANVSGTSSSSSSNLLVNTASCLLSCVVAAVDHSGMMITSQTENQSDNWSLEGHH